MLDALISGTHDPEIPAELANGSLRKKIGSPLCLGVTRATLPPRISC